MKHLTTGYAPKPRAIVFLPVVALFLTTGLAIKGLTHLHFTRPLSVVKKQDNIDFVRLKNLDKVANPFGGITVVLNEGEASYYLLNCKEKLSFDSGELARYIKSVSIADSGQ